VSESVEEPVSVAEASAEVGAPAAAPVSNAAAAPAGPPDVVPQDPAVVLASTFHSQGSLAPQPLPHLGAPAPAPSQVDGNSFFSSPAHPALRAHDVITQVSSGGSFHFLQDSELDSPDLTVPTPHHVVPPIPTQTYANPKFPAPVNPPPASAVPMYQHHAQAQPPVPAAQHHHVVPEAYSAPPTNMNYQQLYVQPGAEQARFEEGERADVGRMEAAQPAAAPSAAQPAPQPAGQAAGATDWAAHQVDTNDWNTQTDNEMGATSHSDGYRTQRGGGGRDRDRERADRGGHEQGQGHRGGRRSHRGGQYSDYAGNRNRDQGGYRNTGPSSGPSAGAAGTHERNSGKIMLISTYP